MTLFKKKEEWNGKNKQKLNQKEKRKIIPLSFKKYLTCLLREEGPSSIKRFKTQLTDFSFCVLCNITAPTS